MRLAKVWFVLFAVATPGIAMAATLHVPLDYPSIQSALAAATYGDSVLVAPGTYYECVVLPNGVVLASESGAGVTAIDGSDVGTVVSCQVVDGTTALVGFTVQHGAASTPGFLGGGMYIRSSDVVVMENVFTSNDATSGGGIFVEGGGQAEIHHNLFAANSAYSGGGVYIQGGDTAPSVHDNTFEDNTAETGGGAICHRAGPEPQKQGAEPEIWNNQIHGNSAHWGGGIYLQGQWATLHIYGNTISGNYGEDHAGGICAYFGSPVAWDNTIENNTTGGCGAALCLLQCESATFTNNRIRENAATICGGGLYAEYSTGIKVDRNQFESNEALATHGGAIYVYECTAAIEWNLFANNTCVERGGGIVWVVNCGIQLRHNTFVGNHAGEGGGIYAGDAYQADIDHNIIVDCTGGYGVYLPPGGTATLSCNDVWNNLPGNYHSLPPGPGDFSEDPLFCGTLGSEYKLDVLSPCVHGYGCGLIGAFPVGCGGTLTERASWSSIKAMYR